MPAGGREEQPAHSTAGRAQLAEKRPAAQSEGHEVLCGFSQNREMTLQSPFWQVTMQANRAPATLSLRTSAPALG